MDKISDIFLIKSNFRDKALNGTPLKPSPQGVLTHLLYLCDLPKLLSPFFSYLMRIINYKGYFRLLSVFLYIYVVFASICND